MQMSDDVRRALQVLRDNAENDFELHWIDRLERDLTNPPKVEVIDNKHQSFLGISFRKRKTGHYFNPMMSIYRFVWIYYRGELPRGSIVHHIDENKDNNDIDNLQAITPHAHMILHKCQGLHDEKFFVCQDCGVTFSSTANRALYCPACRKKRENKKKHQREKEKRQQKREENFWKDCAQRAEKIAARLRTCPVCGRMFLRGPSHRKGTTRRVTCSSECEQKMRHRPHVDHTRICEVCGKTFEYKKNPHQKTCSVECGKIANIRAIKGRQVVERVVSKCEFCGKEIVHLPSLHPRFCSQACLYKYWHKNQTKSEHVDRGETRTCIVCGKQFHVTSEKAKKQYCSAECRDKTRMIPCPICGKMFVPRTPLQKTCSIKCGVTLRERKLHEK